MPETKDQRIARLKQEERESLIAEATSIAARKGFHYPQDVYKLINLNHLGDDGVDGAVNRLAAESPGMLRDDVSPAAAFEPDRSARRPSPAEIENEISKIRLRGNAYKTMF